MKVTKEYLKKIIKEELQLIKEAMSIESGIFTDVNGGQYRVGRKLMDGYELLNYKNEKMRHSTSEETSFIDKYIKPRQQGSADIDRR